MKKFFRSKTFFVLIMLFFVFEAAWMAVSARFPMAFDEAYHLGIIKVYAHQISPILLHQPAGPAPFGALTADPSYLYQYFMSFPYRWLVASGASFQTVIIGLRFINVALMGAALLVFRRILLRTKAGPAVINFTILAFVLIPIVPLLAGEINYDNLQLLVLAINCLLVLHFRDQLARKKQVNAGFLLYVFSFALLGCLVKFTYLPFLLAITLYMIWILAKRLGGLTKVWHGFWRNWATLTRVNRAIATLVFAISLGLFLQRYGVDVIRYHNVEPQCGQVLSVERCMAYGPWARNYNYVQTRHSVGLGNPAVFVGGWLWGMFDRSFFVINGPGSPNGYENHIPLPLMSITAVLVFLFGLYLAWRYRREIFKDDAALRFLLWTSLVYLATLVGRNYHDYLQFGGRLAAINGRYLLMMIIPVLLVIGMGYRKFLQPRRFMPLMAVIFVLFLQGGGFVSFIYFSHPGWYWPNDQFAQRINHDARRVVSPVIVEWPKKSWR
jgi:hypothetical protein